MPKYLSQRNDVCSYFVDVLCINTLHRIMDGIDSDKICLLLWYIWFWINKIMKAPHVLANYSPQRQVNAENGWWKILHSQSLLRHKCACSYSCSSFSALIIFYSNSVIKTSKTVLRGQRMLAGKAWIEVCQQAFWWSKFANNFSVVCNYEVYLISFYIK